MYVRADQKNIIRLGSGVAHKMRSKIEKSANNKAITKNIFVVSLEKLLKEITTARTKIASAGKRWE